MMSVIGRKNAGKTTLLVALAAELARRKRLGRHGDGQRGVSRRVPRVSLLGYRVARHPGQPRVGPGQDPPALAMTMLTPTEAARLILEHIAPLPAMRRSLREALDLVLAEDVASPIDLPPWDNSAMDGYAARGGDVAGASPERKVVLAVVESVAAGQLPARPTGPGQATRIFTGAPLPAGADPVVRQEDTEDAAPDRVTVVTGRDARKNVRYRGEDIRKGEIDRKSTRL